MKNIFTFLSILIATGLSAQNFTNYTEAEGLVNNSVNCLTVDADDNLWFGTQKGVSKFDGTTWTTMDKTSHPGLPDEAITAIFTDKDGILWVGTDFGAAKFDGTSFTAITEDDGLADNRITHITQGPEGIIWMSNKDGVTLYDGLDFASLVMADGLPFGGVAHTTFGSFGRKYFSTPLGGVYIYDGVTLSAVTEDDGLVSNKVRAVTVDANQNKWVSTSDGITVLNDIDKFVENHTRIFEIPAPDTLNPIEDIKIDSKGRIWAGVYVDYLVTEGGVSMYDGNTWVDYDEDDGLVGPVVRQLAIDSKDDVWVATSTGVTKISFPSTAVSELEAAGFEVFPNPVSDILTIKIDFETTFRPEEFRMYNNLGQQVLGMPITDLHRQITVPVAQLPAGMYFASVGGRSLKIFVQ